MTLEGSGLSYPVTKPMPTPHDEKSLLCFSCVLIANRIFFARSFFKLLIIPPSLSLSLSRRYHNHRRRSVAVRVFAFPSRTLRFNIQTTNRTLTEREHGELCT